ncbi:hypothetical protein [Streptomyces sp. WELS2]|uniref:hypothetical protein n=1 Tax=Streptomyces sp. WELS2 TaxID=2749435 RepID=UPI0015F11E47|nr:hypothetical protein [Streptomyces sp. WELS2]
MHKFTAAATAALALGSGLALAPAASAGAAVPAPRSVVASSVRAGGALTAGGTAPACIHRTVTQPTPEYQHVFLYNTCGKTMHVKVIVNYWRDTSCVKIKNRHQKVFTLNFGTYRKTVVC